MPRNHPVPVFSLVLVAGLSGSVAMAQEARPILGALQKAVAQAQERAVEGIDVWVDHSTWDKAWEVRTDHFVVRTTQSYGDGMQIALGMESMLEHFRQALGTDFLPRESLPIYLLPDVAAYNQFGDDHGAEHSSFYGSFHAAQHAEKPVAVAWLDNPTWLRMQITHSVVHQYLDAGWPGTHPTWVVEGLAAYFSIYWDYPWGVAEFERLREQGRLLPLATLVSDQVQAYSENTHARFMQLGMLFYYLFRFREDTRTTLPGEEEERAPFRDYLMATLQRRDTSGLPVHALTQDLEALEKDFLAFEFPRQ